MGHQREGDQKLRQIARAGRQWKKTMTRRADMEGMGHYSNVKICKADNISSVLVSFMYRMGSFVVG